MKRSITLLAAVLALVIAIAGCGSSNSSDNGDSADAGASETTERGSGGAPQSEVKVSYISPVGAQPSMQQLNLGMERAASDLGWSESVLDSALSPDKQVSNVETAINQGVSALASWTLDPNAVAGAYELAGKKGIPVIGINSKGSGVTSTVWWEAQLCEPGGPQDLSAKKIAETHPHAKTIMIGLELAESTAALSTCFAERARIHGLDVINKTNNEADNAAGSQKVFEPLLTKYPEVEAVWCYNDESALGVSAALLAAGKEIATSDNPEGVVVTGANGDKGAVEAVEQGRLSWTWDPDNLATGYAAVELMEEALDGKKPEEVVVEAQLVDAATVADYVQPEDRAFTLGELPLKAKK